eukprot:gene31388-44728_t
MRVHRAAALLPALPAAAGADAAGWFLSNAEIAAARGGYPRGQGLK